MENDQSNPITVGRLKCQRVRDGGQVIATITQGVFWYTQVFGSVEAAELFAEANKLEYIPPPEGDDEMS